MKIDSITIDGVKYVTAKTKCCGCTGCAFFNGRIDPDDECPLQEGLDLDQCPLKCGQVFKKVEV
jgi:hypothetical protein